jgi:aspartate aminotransferase-like enzyme
MYVNNLVMLPGPTAIPTRVKQAMTRPGLLYHRDQDFHELYNEIQAGLRYLYQTKNEVLILTSSSTGGIECVASNTIAPGDEVLTVVNGYFSQEFKHIVELYGGKPIVFSVPWGKPIPVNKLSNLLAKHKDIKSVMLTHNETSTGVRAPLAEIGKVCAEHDKLLIIDVVSSIAGDDVKTDSWNVDISVAGTQKCLSCPPGLALISVSERGWEKIQEVGSRSLYFDLQRYRDAHAKSETPFTPALPLFAALDESLRMIKEEGLDNRIMRHQVCAEAMREGIKAVGLELYPDESAASNTVTVVKTSKDIDLEKARSLLKQQYRVLVSGGIGPLKGKILRIGTMGTVSEPDVVRTISALEYTLKDLGY